MKRYKDNFRDPDTRNLKEERRILNKQSKKILRKKAHIAKRVLELELLQRDFDTRKLYYEETLQKTTNRLRFFETREMSRHEELLQRAQKETSTSFELQ